MSLNGPPVFDPNTWYQLSEARVDSGGKKLTHNLIINDSPPGFGIRQPSDGNHWQFVPADDDVENRYFLRSLKSGTNYHVAVCWHPEEEHEGKTRLCLATASDDAKDQQWDASLWNDGTMGIRFINVKNGTDWWLDVRKGGPPFMNDDIDTGVYKPAQRWLASSLRPVDQADFIIGDASPTKPPGTSATSDVDPTPTNGAGSDRTDGAGSDRTESDDSGSSSGTGLSAGAAAGIGVGVTAAVGIIVAIIFFLLRRKKSKRTVVADHYNGSYQDKTAPVLPHEAPAANTSAHEAPVANMSAHEVDGYASLSPHVQPSEMDASPLSSYPPGGSTIAQSPPKQPSGHY